MRIPVMHGTISRRVLVNYRADLEILSRLLPPPFRPQPVHGYGIVGVCLIRLQQLRPRFGPPFLGISSENAAHRIAVEWDQQGRVCTGVYIPRRDTSSRINTLVGGKLFPGVHHLARFGIEEAEHRYQLSVESHDRDTQLHFDGTNGSELPSDSVFGSLAEASRFFEQGSVGYSPAAAPGKFDGLELRCFNWRMSPLQVNRLESSFFDDREQFPNDSLKFDCALLMRDIEHEWHGRPSLSAPPQPGNDPKVFAISDTDCETVGADR
jgi:hypothetical protein